MWKIVCGIIIDVHVVCWRVEGSKKMSASYWLQYLFNVIKWRTIYSTSHDTFCYGADSRLDSVKVILLPETFWYLLLHMLEWYQRQWLKFCSLQLSWALFSFLCSKLPSMYAATFDCFGYTALLTHIGLSYLRNLKVGHLCWNHQLNLSLVSL